MKDKLTTMFGAGLSIQALSEINLSLLFAGDAAEIGKLVKAIILVAWGYFSNKK